MKTDARMYRIFRLFVIVIVIVIVVNVVVMIGVTSVTIDYRSRVVFRVSNRRRDYGRRHRHSFRGGG